MNKNLYRVFILLLAAPSLALGQTVTQDAAQQGDFGLRVPVGTDCTVDHLVVEPAPTIISGEFKGCLTITARNVEAGTGETTLFTAGDRIALENGFQVATGAVFAAGLDRAIGVDFSYVQDDTPSDETSYAAVLHANLDQLVLGAADQLEHLVGYNISGVEQFIVRFVPDGASYALTIAARENGGSLVELPFANRIALASGWNTIQVNWQAIDGAGSLLVSANGGLQSGLTSLTNGLTRVESVRWGAVAGTVDASSGVVLVDEFVSTR